MNLDLTLPFPAAGVRFELRVAAPAERGSGASFSLVALAAGSDTPIPFESDASPVLADWVRGYTRWLYRARVSASSTRSAIEGEFAPGLSAEQILEGVRLACDMIRQRFELYEETVLTR